MAEPGLRERKKAATRQHIADTAGALFGEHGYENVSVLDVARVADVSEQTVYNYFPTKQDLVLDRADELRERFSQLVLGRGRHTPAGALRAAARAEVQRQRESTTAAARGELPMLSARSRTVRQLALEARDAQADAVAEAIVATTPGVDPLAAKAHASGLVAVFQVILDHTGRRMLEGAAPEVVADELAPAVEAALDELDRAFAAGERARRRAAGSAARGGSS